MHTINTMFPMKKLHRMLKIFYVFKSSFLVYIPGKGNSYQEC